MMSISPHEEKMINLQHQLRHNQSDLQSYLAGLDDWTSEIKEKEKKLHDQGKDDKTDLPPVRNTLEKKKLKKKRREKKVDPSKPKKISGFDFRAWDKFDVDKALDEIDDDDKNGETSSSDYETDEEWEIERKKHLAGLEKDKGNKFLKNGDLDRAVEAYTKGMELDSTNSILPANRALALIKQQKFAAAELDCTSSIVLDPLYVKAYLRRATARAGVGRTQDALDDYRRVLDLEPSNRQAQVEIDRLEKELLREKEGPVKSSYTEGQLGIVKPVYKPMEERSKVPMKRISIEEIGVETPSRPQRSTTDQSEVVQKITAKEGEAFDTLFKSPQTNSQSPGSTSSHSAQSMDSKVHSKKIETVHSEITKIPSDNHKVDSVNTQKDTDTGRLKASHTIPQKNTNVSVHHTQDHKSNEKPAKQTSAAANHINGEGVDGVKFHVPQSSFQFQADFKLLKKKPEAFLQYFLKIPSSQYPKLFGQCLDADILNAILKALTLGPHNEQTDLFDILHDLTLVKRFSMTAMFLSSKDKKVVADLFSRVTAEAKHSETDVESLRQKYQL